MLQFCEIWKKYFLRSLTFGAIGANTRFFKMWPKSMHDQKFDKIWHFWSCIDLGHILFVFWGFGAHGPFYLISSFWNNFDLHFFGLCNRLFRTFLVSKFSPCTSLQFLCNKPLRRPNRSARVRIQSLTKLSHCIKKTDESKDFSSNDWNLWNDNMLPIVSTLLFVITYFVVGLVANPAVEGKKYTQRILFMEIGQGFFF